MRLLPIETEKAGQVASTAHAGKGTGIRAPDAPVPAPIPSPVPVPVPAPLPVARAAPWPLAEDAAFVLAWDRLALTACEPNPFLESWALLPALRALDPGRSALLFHVEQDGNLIGLMPIAPEQGYYGKPIPHLAGWMHPNAFLGAPLVALGAEVAFWRALLAWADANAGWSLFLHISALPLDGPLHAALQDVLAGQDRPCGLVHREERALLASALDPDGYLSASMSGKKRKELRRQSARLAETGALEFVHQSDATELDAWIEEFLALEASGWKGKAGSALAARPETAMIFRETLRGGADLGKLERLALRLDGRAIAMLANLVSPPGMFSYKTAFDESQSRFSPGVLLQIENLKVLDRPEIAWSDSCAAADHPMIDRIWRERRPIGRLSIGIGGKIRRAIFRRLLAIELGRNPTGVTA